MLFECRLVWRALLKAKGITLIAIGTVAVGLAANIATFSVVDRLLFRSAAIQIVVLELVPRAGAPNVYSPERLGQLLRRELVRFSLPSKAGASRVVEELRKLGMQPLTVRLEAELP